MDMCHQTIRWEYVRIIQGLARRSLYLQGSKQGVGFKGQYFPSGSDGKDCLQCRKPRLDPWVRKILWKREWLTTPVFLPGEFHGQRSLAGYSPWGHGEADPTEQLSLFKLVGTQAQHVVPYSCLENPTGRGA